MEKSLGESVTLSSAVDDNMPISKLLGKNGKDAILQPKKVRKSNRTAKNGVKRKCVVVDSKSKIKRPSKVKKKSGKKSLSVSRPIKSSSILTMTLKDINKSSQKKCYSAEDKKRFCCHQPVRIKSLAEREKIYQQTAELLSVHEAAELPSYGGRSWKCDVTVIEPTALSNSQMPRKNRSKMGPLFRWHKGKLELASLPNLLDKIPKDLVEVDVDLSCTNIDNNKGKKRKNSEKQNSCNDSESLSDPKQKFDEGLECVREFWRQLQQERMPVTPLSTEAGNPALHPQPVVRRTWISPQHLIFKTRKAALAESEKFLRRDALIDKVIYGIGAEDKELRATKISAKLALEAGKMRFDRDGLWVIGQEEEWQQDRIKTIFKKQHEAMCANKNSQPLSPIDWRKIGNSTTVTSCAEDCNKSLESSSLTHCTNEPRTEPHIIDKDPSETEINRRPSFDDSSINSSASLSIKGNDSNVSKTLLPYQSPSSNQNSIPNSGQEQLSSSGVSSDIVPSSTPSIALNHVDIALVTPHDINSPTTFANGNARESLSKVQLCEHKMIASLAKYEEYSRWCLNKSQIEMCYKACVDHYEKVMYTVKARALYCELLEGFDVFRERGRGRFDMELEEFDLPCFSFLNDNNKAPWIDAIKSIFDEGDGAEPCLIHKGCFLSMPGAETQVYHQDGPHLSYSQQLPCHAVNVFIPLIDLHLENGPTEYCLGTQILGYECFVKEMCETPTVKAGTPIIFDYRLGHRGMGNRSKLPRPIVYLTYTQSARTFKDDVNFSRKRYHKLGEVVVKAPSRQERALRRQRMSEGKDEGGAKATNLN